MSGQFMVIGLLFPIVAYGLVGGQMEEELIGWRGETFKSKSKEADPSTDRWVQVISWKPRAFVMHNFLSKEEAAHILSVAAPQMKRSLVVGPNDTGVVDNIRTSAGTFIRRQSDDVIKRVERRLSIWSQLPASHQEDMQVLRYGPTNKYGAHVDGLGRVMSVLLYLVAPEEGGETAFPRSDGWLHAEMAELQGKFSNCAEGHVAYKPKVGDALMFYDLRVDYLREDMNSEHTGCPVVKGVKWNAVKWIHGKPFRPDDFKRAVEAPDPAAPDPSDCVDNHPQCVNWAKAGECDNNPAYMKGGPSSDGQGNCRLACAACKVCAPDDQECRDENRRSGGFITYNLSEFGPLSALVNNWVKPASSLSA